MVHDYARNLKFDRRLLSRRGWITPEELEKELADLPDVSHKAQPREEGGGPSPGPDTAGPQGSNQTD